MMIIDEWIKIFYDYKINLIGGEEMKVLILDGVDLLKSYFNG
jgi:hypothetical protein